MCVFNILYCYEHKVSINNNTSDSNDNNVFQPPVLHSREHLEIVNEENTN